MLQYLVVESFRLLALPDQTLTHQNLLDIIQAGNQSGQRFQLKGELDPVVHLWENRFINVLNEELGRVTDETERAGLVAALGFGSRLLEELKKIKIENGTFSSNELTRYLWVHRLVNDLAEHTKQRCRAYNTLLEKYRIDSLNFSSDFFEIPACRDLVGSRWQAATTPYDDIVLRNELTEILPDGIENFEIERKYLDPDNDQSKLWQPGIFQNIFYYCVERFQNFRLFSVAVADENKPSLVIIRQKAPLTLENIRRNFVKSTEHQIDRRGVPLRLVTPDVGSVSAENINYHLRALALQGIVIRR
jgi:hypothetical protein